MIQGAYDRTVTARQLFEDNRDLAVACRDHPFVAGIASGQLDVETFAFYVGQDAAFLDAFCRAYALGVAKAPDTETMTSFKALLDGAVDEVRLHVEYASRWGVDLAGVVPSPATRAYTDFLLRVAALEPIANMCAAMVPCMRRYAWLGRELEPCTATDNRYREWVNTYASTEFGDLAATLEALLDRLGGDPAVVADRYRTAMQLELAFFRSAYEHGR